jgi:hypothetical protein
MDSIQEMYGADTKMKVVFTGGLCDVDQYFPENRKIINILS